MKSKVISASAGTGKTYRLALEFLAALLQDRTLKPEDILVMTFTVKATSEIKQRILDFLKICPNDRNLQDNLKNICNLKLSEEDFSYLNSFSDYLLFDKSKLKVYTLDSYLQSLFSCLVSQDISDSSFSVSSSLSARKREDVLEKIFALEESHKFFIDRQDKNLDKFSEFVDRLLSINLREFKNKNIEYEKELGKLKDSLSDLQFAASAVSPKNPISAVKMFRKPFWTLLEKRLGSLSEDFAVDFSQITKDEQFYLDALKDSGNDIWKKSPFLSKTKCDNLEALEKFKETYSEFQNFFRDFLIKTKVYTEHNQLLDLAVKSQNYYSESIDGKLTFADFGRILQDYFCKGDFLTESDKLKEVYWQFLDVLPKILMIDEFQDTSVSQYLNLLPIINAIKEKDGSVIIVGDAKQAIYSWRGGEQRLLGMMSDILPDCNSLFLNTNYRSSVNIVDSVNNLFSKEYGDLWDYQAVNSSLKTAGFVNFEIRKSEAKNGKLKDLITSFVKENIAPALKNNEIDLSKCAVITRKNNELSLFAEALKESGIETYQKQADSILEHKAIKPFIYFLKFQAYDDLYSLYQFLKGAPLFLDGVKIKNILENKDLQSEYKIKNSTNIFSDFIRKFNYLEYFTDRNDQKNILALAKILSEIDNDSQQILEYLDENKDELKKVGESNKNAVNLLTIHSCKGLEFDTVFYFMDCSNRKKNTPELADYVFYNTDFTEVEDSILTYSYKSLVENSYNIKQKSDLEILNLVYVALTRAVKNLFVFSNFSIKKSDEDDFNILEKLSYELMNGFSENEIIEKTGEIFSAKKGVCEIAKKIDEVKRSSYKWNEQSLNLPNSYEARTDQKSNKENLLFGEIVHYYLSLIKWNTEKEKKLARKMTLGKFGLKWKNYLLSLDEKIAENTWLYDKQKWGNVLCEMPIVDDGKEYRIDRIMISHDNKYAFVVDYKTGEIANENQLEIYRAILEKAYGFTKIETAYLEIK